MKKYLYLIPAAMLLFASCATKSAYVLSGDWSVVKLNDQTITPAENTPFIGFDLNEGHVYGFTGCNRMTGELNARKFMKGEANFGHMATTRMLCQDDKYEQPLLEALGKVTTSEVSDKEITLKDKDGNVLLVLKKKSN